MEQVAQQVVSVVSWAIKETVGNLYFHICKTDVSEIDQTGNTISKLVLLYFKDTLTKSCKSENTNQ